MIIQNIIFDFGNVLFDINMDNIKGALQGYFGERYRTALDKLLDAHVFELYETGGLSTEEFVNAIRFADGPPLTTEQVVSAWNSIFIGMPAERFELLLRLRQRYKVFLLSNINDLHAHWIDDYMVREHGIADFQTRYFDGVYYSHLIRLRKPNRDIYEYVLADAELLPGESIFFDDLEINVEGARAAGIQAVWHQPGSDIVERMGAWLD